jgi:hypothetical protein
MRRSRIVDASDADPARSLLAEQPAGSGSMALQR